MTEPLQRYLLDTNVISATRDSRQDPVVSAFLAPLRVEQLFISVITVGELYKGYFGKDRRYPGGAPALGRWIAGVEQRFADRILPVDLAVAKIWGDFCSGRSRAEDDMLIAATALLHDLTVVTRDEFDFADLPVRVLNPWHA
jgi:predicted nucleic acid-binding protein